MGHESRTAAQRRALDAFVKLMRASYWTSLRAGARRRAAGLTETQFGVLEALHHLGPLIQTRLAQKVLHSPSNLTTVIDNLERAGLVERVPHPDDRRAQLVRLTTRGRARIRELLPTHLALIADLMGALTASEQRELGRLCRKLGLSARDRTVVAAAPGGAGAAGGSVGASAEVTVGEPGP